jgi:dTDP-4-amino-4,6-dideoxygalactose transaminase
MHSSLPVSTPRAPRATFLPFALPDIDDDDVAGVVEALRSHWVTTGPATRAFEAEFAAAVGAKHAIAVNSCTAAMHLALEAIGLAPGDEVITTPYTFAATAEVIRYFDARPVLVDVDRRTLTMDPGQVEQAITSRTRAILPIHIAGLPADLDALLAISRARGIPLIEDAAHAFPCLYKGRPVGSIGDFTAFSFYATKTITTGEGGMICTDNDRWAERCRIMSLHGISKDAWKRYTAEGSWYYEIIAPGFKYNMTDVAAAMGRSQLRKAERMLARRREIARAYSAAFAAGGAFELPTDLPDCQHSWHLYMLRLHADRLDLTRAQFIEELKARNIGTSVHFIPLHVHPYYREKFGYRPEDFPVAYEEYQREISLPIFSGMTDADVDDVIAAVIDLARAHRR